MSTLFEVASASAFAKVVAFFLVWVALWLPVAIPVARVLDWRPPAPLAVEQRLPLLVPLYLIAPSIVWGAARLEGVPFSNYGLTTEPTVLISLGMGLGAGILGLAILFGIQLALGWIAWQQTSQNQLHSVLLSALLLALWVGGTEELIFRGFLLNQLQSDYPNWVSAVISSLIFSLLHLIWNWQETVPQLLGLWLMGMVLVEARFTDGGSLGLAWGLHAGWVWGIASLEAAKLITYTGRVPEWMSGLGGKPLAGAIAFLLLLVTAAVLRLV